MTAPFPTETYLRGTTGGPFGTLEYSVLFLDKLLFPITGKSTKTFEIFDSLLAFLHLILHSDFPAKNVLY